MSLRLATATPGLAAVVLYGLVCWAVDGPGICGDGEHRLFAFGVALLVAAVAATVLVARRRGRPTAVAIATAVVCALLAGPVMFGAFFAVSFGSCFVF